jgi:snapalysin
MFKKSFLNVAVGAAMIIAPLTAGQAAADTSTAGDVHAAATTVCYETSGAPSFTSAINQGAANWNASVSNVRLVNDPSCATLSYYEGNDPSGSYASTDGHGSGYIFIDYTQAQQYYIVRITAHETGHVLGLPDHYTGPCSELMSGGGPGTSCTNAYPNGDESGRVNSLWANGFKGATGEFKKIYN